MILMRHGDCFPDYENDPGLSPAGYARIRHASYSLLSYPFSVILHSDKRRTIETVATLQALLPKVATECHPALREIHPLALQDAQHEDALRAAAAFQRFVRPHLGKPVLLVAHRNILQFFCRQLGLANCFEEFGEYISV